MSLLFQLLPFLLLAAISAIALMLYVIQTSKSRLGARSAKSARVAQNPILTSTAAAAVAHPKQASHRNTPILRLHELDMTPLQIATALERPLQEIEIVLKFEEAKRRRLAVS